MNNPENPRGLPVAWGIPGMALVVTDAQKKLGQAPGATVALVLATDYAAIVAERDALRADAARWREVRELDGGAIYALLGDCDGIHPEQADTAIDAAMAAEGRDV